MTKVQSLQTHWYDKTVKAHQLAGMGESTQESYARAVRKLIEFHDKDPLVITEEELKNYFLYCLERIQMGTGYHENLLLWFEILLHPCA